MSQVTNTVRFVLDGKIVEAQGARRTTTVLDYLREDLHRTGTKEGLCRGRLRRLRRLGGRVERSGNGRGLRANQQLHAIAALAGRQIHQNR